MQYRLLVEAEYLISLSEQRVIRQFSKMEKEYVRRTVCLSEDDFLAVKYIESKTHHDVKAVEYYLKEKLQNTSLYDVAEFVHFALTSEDVNNIAHALMLGDGIEKCICPPLTGLNSLLENLAKQHKDLPMLARTHGQPASPTTLGKEFKVFSSRLQKQNEQLGKLELLAKLNGATGNYNAHYAARPDVDWIDFSRSFIEHFNSNRKMLRLKLNHATTQIEPHDSYVELFDVLRRINVILIGLNQDMWRYISDGWLVQKAADGEVGSSTMPHKVNPIDFEESEGALGMANALLAHFSTKLPISRLQRDLSDSTVMRNFGAAVGYCLLGYESVLKGLAKIMPDEIKIIGSLESHPEVIAEAYQTILRREGMALPYEQLKELTRGKKVTMPELHAFVDSLHVSDAVKSELKQITPINYTGLARILAEK